MLIKPTSFNPKIVRTEGSDVNVALAASAAMAEEVARFSQASNNETFLALAEAEGGEVLDRWIYDRYGETRQEAQAAVATVTLTRTDTDGVTAEEGLVVGTPGGVNYRTINDVVFPANNLGPFDVLVIAEQTGEQGNVAAGLINAVISNVEGDSTIAVTNVEPAAGGSPEESDEEFAARAREFFVTARRGTGPAIQTGAVTTEGVQQATVIETLDPASTLPNFRVQLIIADRDGQANAALAGRVRERLVTFRCLGVPVLITAGTPEFVQITIAGLQFKSGVNTTNVLQEARNAVLAIVNAIAPGAVLEVASIIAALKTVDGLFVPADAVSVPAGDLVPATGGVIRTTKDRISLNEAA